MFLSAKAFCVCVWGGGGEWGICVWGGDGIVWVTSFAS